MLPGTFQAKKKDGTIYYRSSITHKEKHISLGSFPSEADAHAAYLAARTLLSRPIDPEVFLSNFTENSDFPISFDKGIILINLFQNHMYISNPIYLRKNYFSYYLSPTEELKFDIDDLFYYSSHRIIRRKGHLFVNDYGMQVTILSRYGIQPHAVCGRDYIFVNGDASDWRYSNIQILNPYHGVLICEQKGIRKYRVRIHINGNFTVGVYSTPEKAAIAYNKAVDLAHRAGINKNFPENYIESLSGKEYADLYTKLKIAPKYINYLQTVSSNTSK